MMSVDWERIKSQRTILKVVLPVISNDKVEFVIIVEIRVCRPDGDSLVGHLTSQAQDLLFDDYSDMELLCSDVYIAVADSCCLNAYFARVACRSRSTSGCPPGSQDSPRTSTRFTF